MSKADTHATTTAAAPSDDEVPPGAVADMEPLLHDLEAEIGLLAHVANSRTQIASGELIALETHLVQIQRDLMGLWHKAWDDDLARRFGAANHQAPAASHDVELISLCDRLVAMDGEEPIAQPAAETPPAISTIAAYVEGLASGIMTMAKRMGGTMNGGISTISAGLALALERAHPMAALMLGRQASLVAATEPRCTVVEYVEKKQAAQATVEGQGMTNAELADLHVNRPDGGLLHMAREFAKVDAQIQVLNELPDPSEAAMDAVASRQFAITDVMIDTPAKTAAGWRAKAEVLDASIRLDVTSPDSEHRLATSLAADLMKGIKADR
jgi:hypothetical protein